MNKGYGKSGMGNQSQFGGYSQQDQSVAGNNYMMQGMSGKSGKPIPQAGILNSKTLAEENLKGFRLRNL